MSAAKDYWESLRGTRPVYPTIDTRGVKPIEAPPDSTVDKVLDALAAGVGTGEEHFGELTGLKNFTEEGRAMKERNLHQYEDNSFDYHLQNILMSAPESAAIMAASMGAGWMLGGPVGALGGAARGILSQSPRMASLMWNLAKAYQGGSTAAKVARTVIPSTPQTAIAVETGALMEAQVEGLEAEKRYIENAKANGTYVEGQTEAEAAEVRSNVVRDNVGIVSMFNAPQYQAIMGRPVRSLLGKLGRFGAAAGSEGAEEVAQELASAYELGESPQWRNLRDAAIAGTAMGGAFHGIGRGVPYALDRIAGRPTYEELEDQRKANAKEFSERIGKVNVGEDKKATYDDDALYGAFRSAAENFANRQERGARQSYREAQQENLTQKQAEIWDAAQYASQRAKEKYGIDLSPELIYKQWAHEAGVNFDSPNARYNNNFGGLTQTEPNGEENKQPDGNNYYRHFNSVQEYAEAYVDDYIRHRPELNGVKNEREFAQVMHDTGYFTDSVNNYTAGMEGITAPTSRTGVGQNRGGNVFGVENYDMPTQGDNITAQVSQLKPGWSSVIPQIGGALKDKFGINATISSAARSAEHNAEVGGAENSYHIIRDEGGDALDIVFDRETSQEEQDAIADYFKSTGLFSEVLYHDVGSGAHLHLGGLNTAALTQSVQSKANEIFSNRTRNDEAPQWQDYKQNEKPLFDINAEDETTRKLFEQYAEERLVNSTDRDTVNFFDGMFTADGNFQNTPENRDAIRERYGDDFIKWVTNQQNQQNQQTTQEEKSAQTNPPKTQPPKQTNSPLRNAPVIETATKFLEQLRAKGDPQNLKTALNLQSAISNGDIATVENILKQNNVTIPTLQTQTQSENVVKENTTPENVTKQKTSPLERQIKTARAPVPTGSGNKNKRIKQGNAIIALANENKIEIPGGEMVALQNGSTKAVQKWRDTLLESGILDLPQTQSTLQNQEQTLQADKTSQQANPQQQSQVQTQSTSQNQQTTLQEIQAARENWENTKRGYQERGEKIQAARREEEERQRRERQAETEEEVRQRSKKRYEQIIQEKAERDKQAQEQKAELERQEKQNRELQELESRRTAQQRQSEENQRIKAEQESEISQRQNLANNIAAALAPHSANKNTRIKQGTGIADLINSTPFKDMFGVISLPAGLETSLRNGDEKGLRAAQAILNRRGVRPIDWYDTNAVTNKIDDLVEENPKTEEETYNYEPPPKVHPKSPVITHETPENKYREDRSIPQIDRDSELAISPVPNDKGAAKAQGQAILRLINSPQFKAAYGRINLPAGLEQSLRRGDRKGIEAAQRILKTRVMPMNRSETSTEQSQVKEETQPQSQRQEQTKRENERDVFDLIPDVDELNDVEEESETPQAQTQSRSKKESAPQTQSKRKKSSSTSKPKRSKRADKLHEKLKTDTHPLIGAYLDRLLKIAASREKSPERSKALSELELYEKREITDEMLDRAEKNLQKKQEEEEKSNGTTSTSEKTETEKSSRTEENSDKDTVSRQTQTQEVSESQPESQAQEETKSETKPQKKAESVQLFTTEERDTAGGKRYFARMNTAAFPFGKILDNNVYNAVKHYIKKFGGDITDFSFGTREDCDRFVEAVQKNRILEKEIERQKRYMENINGAIEEAYQILEVDKYPEMKTAVDRTVANTLKRKEISEEEDPDEFIKKDSKELAERLVKAAKEHKANNGKMANVLLTVLWNEKYGNEHHLNQKLQQKFLKTKEIVELVKSGELTVDDAYAAIKYFLKTGKRKNLGKEKVTESESKPQERTKSQSESQAQEKSKPVPAEKSEVKTRTRQTLFKGEKEIKEARQMIEKEVPAGTKVRVKAIPNTGSKEPIETHYIIGEGYIQRVDEDGNPIGKEYVRDRNNTTKFFVRNTKGNGYSVAELEIEYPNSQTETKTETKAETKPETKAESKPAEKTPYDEYHAKLKTDKHPHLKTWLDKLINGASSVRAALFKLRMQFDKETFTDNQLDNAEKNLIAYEKEHGELPDKLDFEEPRISREEIDAKIDAELHEAAKDRNVANAFKQLGATIKDGKITFADYESRNMCIEYMRSLQSNDAKNFGVGELKDAIKSVFSPENLNAVQKALSDFAKQIGVPVIFFRGDTNLHGAHRGGFSLYNVDAKFSHDFVYWHEFGHWLKNNQPKLFQQLLDAAEITDEQIAEKKKSRKDLTTDEEIKEEIICDAMSDMARRTGLLKQIGKKNPSLIERLASWAQSMLRRFTDWFHTKERGLNTEQRNRMFDVFGKVFRQVEDANGNKIFRYNRRTHELEHIDGRKLETVDTSGKAKASMTTSEIKKDTYVKIDESVSFTNFGEARKIFKQKMLALKDVPIVNKATGIVAQVGRDGRRKPLSSVAIDKSLANGYSAEQHFAAAMNIKKLFENAWLAEENADKNNQPNVISIKRFHCNTTIGGEKAIARITAKEIVEFGHRLYTIELQELNKPAELENRTGGNSSASSKGSTITHHIAGSYSSEEPSKSNITQKERDNKPKFSMDTSDNSNESFLRRVRNKVSALFDTSSQNTRRNKAIKDTLSKLSGYRIIFGHTTSDETIVDDLQKIIQSKHAYDWEKLLPKVGGKIASNLNLDATEEMNNYIADWLLTGALNNNSADAKAFAKAMRDNPAQSELLQVVRDTFQEFADMTPTERIKSTIVRRQDKPLPQRAKEIISREEWIDDLNPLQKHVDRMIEQSSPEVADIIKKEVDPYKMARLLKGMGALADMMIGEHGDDLVKIRKALQTQYPNVNFDNFKTLSSIIKSVGGDLEGLEAYALAKLDKEIHEKNRAGGKYITPSFSEEADDAAIKEGEKKFGQAQKDLVEYSRTLLAMQYSAGLITQNKFYAYLNGWQNYIPTPRVFDEDETFDVADSFKQKQGSKRDTFSPIQKLAANTQVFLRQAERNKVKLQLATLARFGNFGNIIAEVEKPNPNIKNVIRFVENGKAKYLETPDLALVRAVESLQTQADSNVIIQALKVTMSFMRAAYTSLNPDFAAGNAFRDLADAYIHNRHLNANPILALLDVWRAGFKGIVTKDQDYYDWLASGGSQSGFITESANTSERAIENLTRDSRKGNYFSKAWNKFRYLIELSENVTRLNTYKAAKKNLAAKHGGAATITDMRLAALAARDASVDFARSGKSMRTVNKFVLFSNAAVQGLWQWGEKLRPSKLKTKEGQKEFFSAAFRAVMMGVMPAIIQSALNYGDDDRRKKYENRPDWEKDTYWIFGDGVRVPKGMDLGIRTLSALTDEAIDWLVKNDPVEAGRIFRNLGGGFPSLTATIFTPAFESYANYSIFRDAPIVPYREQSLPKYLQYGAGTSWVAKQLGEVINESPRMIDHLISGYLGFLGRFASGGSDEIPVVRRFFFDPDKNPKIVKDYYNALNEQEELYRGYKFERDRGKKVDLPEDYDAGLHKRLKAAQKQMQALSKQERKLIEDEKLSSDEQKAKLRELEKRRVALCEKVFKRAQ